MPPKVADVEAYWSSPPPAPSPRLCMWLEKIRDGWRPNKRIRAMGYYEAAEWYGVYLWEWLEVLRYLFGSEPSPTCDLTWWPDVFAPCSSPAPPVS